MKKCFAQSQSVVLNGHSSALWGILEICSDVFGGQDDWKELLAFTGRRPGVVDILQFAGQYSTMNCSAPYIDFKYSTSYMYM